MQKLYLSIRRLLINRYFFRLSRIFILIITLSGCITNSKDNSAVSVVELFWNPQSVKQIKYHVKANDSLYAIALTYDADYRQIAVFNNLRYPYKLYKDQIIVINLPQSVVSNTAKLKIVNSKRHFSINKPPFTKNNNLFWQWPAKGKLLTNYNLSSGQKGIDILGIKGGKIYAAANGKVAYVGSGLKSYGNMIIITHSQKFLTAYSHNLSNLVKEGEKVTKGQVIATMGSLDLKKNLWGVHFELRKAGRPLDPLNYLSDYEISELALKTDH